MERRRNRVYWICAGVSVIGLVLGAVIAAMASRPVDRAAAGIEMFRTVCVPFPRDRAADVESLAPQLVRVGRSGVWADPQSKVLLEVTERGCAVSDVLLLFSEGERERFEENAARLVADDFPMLTADHNHGLDHWDLFELWAQYDRGDRRRWVVNLMRVTRWPSAGDNAWSYQFETEFSVTIPGR